MKIDEIQERIDSELAKLSAEFQGNVSPEICKHIVEALQKFGDWNPAKSDSIEEKAKETSLIYKFRKWEIWGGPWNHREFKKNRPVFCLAKQALIAFIEKELRGPHPCDYIEQNSAYKLDVPFKEGRIICIDPIKSDERQFLVCDSKGNPIHEIAWSLRRKHLNITCTVCKISTLETKAFSLNHREGIFA